MKTKATASQDYEKLKQFVNLFYEWHMKLPSSKPESHPLVALTRLEETSPTKARIGLEMAANDIIERSVDWSPEQVNRIDTQLAEEGALMLSEVRSKYSKRQQRVLKRGTILNETEYFLIKGILDGMSCDDTTGYRKMESMLTEFESKASKHS